MLTEIFTYLKGFGAAPVLLLCWGISWIAAYWGTKASIACATRFGITDKPGEIKIHTTEMPRFGGIGIVLGVFVVIGGLFLWRIGPYTETLALLLWGLPVVLTGAVDDIRGLTPVSKLIGQLVGCLGASAFIVRGAVPGLDTAVMLIWTVVLGGFLCFLTNSVNLLDGMDGLAAGSVGIISTAHACAALLGAGGGLDVLPMAISGACAGFLIWNLPPARTFMGDVGSLFLGYAIGVNSLRLILQGGPSVAKLCGVALTLVVPISDTSLAVVRRLLLHRNMMTGDRMHIYDCMHRRLGGDTKRTLSVMWSISILVGLGGVAATVSPPGWSIALALMGYAIIALIALGLGALGPSSKAKGSGVAA
ncbi:MAG: undecaprenyl/decaprenyl-phosphate alpha-N-acetylglucosaminyl 1-phosphate transferase [Firmicutes bacterium]|nr:undecaprenyl/decaprenyl-phosphate alpha-N-acetylglucosaminyl 1-phosphate transferase [Bacillota bacterium]